MRLGPSLALHAAVAAGSAVGAVARYGASLSLLAVLGPGFPWGTLVVNGAGSFLIGAYMAVMASKRWWSGPVARHFVTAGFCGGFTTFSIFSLESLYLWQAGLPRLAAVYIGGSVLLWLAAVWAGNSFAKRFWCRIV